MALAEKWFDNDEGVKKAKESRHLEKVISPPVYYSVELGKEDEPGRVTGMICDPWCDSVVCKVRSPWKACIKGEHCPEEAPKGSPIRTLIEAPPNSFYHKRLQPLKEGEWYATSIRPRVWSSGTLPMVRFYLTSDVHLDAPPAQRKVKQITIQQAWDERFQKDERAPLH